MTGRTSGLQQDVEIVRRRAWLFLPFLILGILVALALHQRSSGTSSAQSTIQLQTSIYDLTAGGDRGFKVYDAQALTRLPQFRKEVVDKIGDSGFDYARFGIILNPNVTTEGVSSGNLVVTISAGSRADAQKYMQAFLDVFNKEFTGNDGLFRTRFVQQQQTVAKAADEQYATAYQQLQKMADAAGVTAPLSQLASGDQSGGYLDQLAQDRANLATQEAEAQAALDSIGSAGSGAAGAIASGIFGQPVAGGDAEAALQARVTTLKAAIAAVDTQLATASGTSLSPELRTQVATVRALDTARQSASNDVANAQAALASAFTSADPSTTVSGGNVTSLLALIAIVIGVTVVFGLIAIYLLEWLLQVRAGDLDQA